MAKKRYYRGTMVVHDGVEDRGPPSPTLARRAKKVAARAPSPKPRARRAGRDLYGALLRLLWFLDDYHRGSVAVEAAQGAVFALTRSGTRRAPFRHNELNHIAHHFQAIEYELEDMFSTVPLSKESGFDSLNTDVVVSAATDVFRKKSSALRRLDPAAAKESKAKLVALLEYLGADADLRRLTV